MTESAKQQTDAEIRAAAERGLRRVCEQNGIVFVAERPRLVDAIVELARGALGVERATAPGFIGQFLEHHVECVACCPEELRAKLFGAGKKTEDV